MTVVHFEMIQGCCSRLAFTACFQQCLQVTSMLALRAQSPAWQWSRVEMLSIQDTLVTSLVNSLSGPGQFQVADGRFMINRWCGNMEVVHCCCGPPRSIHKHLTFTSLVQVLMWQLKWWWKFLVKTVWWSFCPEHAKKGLYRSAADMFVNQWKHIKIYIVYIHLLYTYIPLRHVCIYIEICIHTLHEIALHFIALHYTRVVLWAGLFYSLGILIASTVRAALLRLGFFN